ncbi:MAG: TonB-dependent receptor [Termitinemataceae bacterium]|nr:MAG: TonB-dependent receptor [Termitinemataceae bacterium]
MKKLISLLLAALCGIFFDVGIYAQAVQNDDEKYSQIPDSKDEITVTGTRYNTRLKDTPVAVEIITSEEIAEQNADTIEDVLANYGLEHNTNGMGDYVTMQGLGEGRILYLINGRRIAGRLAQRMNGETMPLGDIQRIEIVRGPQSALYGSDSIGGVINIITKKPDEIFSFKTSIKNRSLPAYNNPETDDDPDPSYNIVNNIFHEQILNVTTNFAVGAWHTSLVLGAARSAFYLDEQKQRSILPEYYRFNGALNSNIKISDTVELNFGGTYMNMQSDDSDDSDKSAINLTRYSYTRAGGYVDLEWRPNSDWGFNFNIYDDYYQRDKDEYTAKTNFWDSGNNHENENIAAAGVLGNYYGFDHWVLTVGLDGSYNSMKKFNFDNDGSKFAAVDKESLFLQAERFTKNKYSVIGGIRLERNSQFGFIAAPKISAMYHISPNVRILGGAGMGYRAPAFSDLYQLTDSAAYVVYNNPDINPEYSISVNGGTEFYIDFFTAHINYYYSEMFDEIVAFYKDNDGDIYYGSAPKNAIKNDEGKNIRYRDNIARSRRTGLDAEMRVNIFKGIYTAGGYSWIYAYNITEDKEIHDTPASTVKLKIGFDNKIFNSKARVPIATYLQGRFSTPIGDETQWDDAKFILDYYFNITIAKHWTISAAVNNILGKISYRYDDTGTTPRLRGWGPKTPQQFTLGFAFKI